MDSKNQDYNIIPQQQTNTLMQVESLKQLFWRSSNSYIIKALQVCSDLPGWRAGGQSPKVDTEGNLNSR